MNKKIFTTAEELDTLYNQSALTLEGLSADDDNLKAFEKWLTDNGVDTSNATFCIVSGKTMNDIYGLTGTNRYQDDLTLVAVDQIDSTPIILKRFEIGGRWFDDIVANNASREEEDEEYEEEYDEEYEDDFEEDED